MLFRWRVGLWPYRSPIAGFPIAGYSWTGLPWAWSSRTLSPWAMLPPGLEISFPKLILLRRENLLHFHAKFLKLSFNLLSEFLKKDVHFFTSFSQKFLRMLPLLTNKIHTFLDFALDPDNPGCE